MTNSLKSKRLQWLYAALALCALLVLPRLWNIGVESYKYGSAEKVEATLSANPNDAKAHLILADELSSQGKLDEAIAHYRDAVRLNPGKVKYQNSLAMALDRHGEEAESLQIYRAVAQSNSKYADNARLRLRIEQEYIKNGRVKSLNNLKR